MYRVVKESYPNYINTVDGYRLSIIKPFELLTDINLYNQHKQDESEQYKALSYFLYHIRDCNKCNVILDELAARGIEGKQYNITDNTDLNEQHKIFHMFLNLVYWQKKQ